MQVDVDLHGSTVEDLEVEEGAGDPSESRQRPRVLSLDDLKDLPPPRWQVADLLPAAGVSFLVSAPNVGKSLLTLDWTLCAAHGIDWLGRRVRPGSGILVVAEGLRGLHQRAEGWRLHHPEAKQKHHVAVVHGLAPLSTPEGRADLRSVVKKHVAAHGELVLISVDTLALHWAGSENDAEHVGPAMARLGAIAVENEAAILLLHHERKSQPGGTADLWASLRGSGALAGAADAVLRLEEAREVVKVTTVKMRDAERAVPLHLAIRKITLPTCDDDGFFRRAPVLVEAEKPEQAATDPEDDEREREQTAVEALLSFGGTIGSKDTLARKMGGRLSTARDAINRLIATGRIVPEGPARRQTYRLVAESQSVPPRVCETAPYNPPDERDEPGGSRSSIVPSVPDERDERDERDEDPPEETENG